MRILVCGDAMTDLYWRGTVCRISPEAPVPVVAVSSVEKRAGGAANVANNIEAMGVQVERIYGQSPERIQKIRLLGNGQHLARMDFDHPQSAIQANDTYRDALERCEIVVFIDYGKGSLADIQSLIAAARSAGRQVLIDPKGHEYAKYRGATLIKPNREEMRELVGGWGLRTELDFKARQFLHASGIESILLTQDAEGMTLYTTTDTLHLDPEEKHPVDISGAGEAALAAFAAGMARGHHANECARYANKAAALACAVDGTGIVTAKQIFGTG